MSEQDTNNIRDGRAEREERIRQHARRIALEMNRIRQAKLNLHVVSVADIEKAGVELSQPLRQSDREQKKD
jgi:hypothetical protein